MKHSFHIQSKPGRSLLVGLFSALILLPMTSCEDFLNPKSSYFSDSTLDNPSDTLYSVVGIINKLQLRRPIYAPTAAQGHFGVEDRPWEQTDLAPILKELVNA